MLQRKKLVRALVVLLAVYGLLALPWPGLARAFTVAYAAAADGAMALVLPFEGTTIRAKIPGDRYEERFDDWDLLVRFPLAPGATSIHGVRVQLRRIAYVPAALAVAVAVAFPSRGRRLLYGALATAGVLLAFQAVGILSVFTTRHALDLGWPVNLAVALGARILLEAPGVTFALPTLVWVATVRPPVLFGPLGLGGGALGGFLALPSKRANN